MTALVAATGTAALAAPASFVAHAVHASGTGAVGAQATGSLSWSSSLKTVTITNVKFYVKGGECGSLAMTGWQGNTAVTSTYLYPADGSDLCVASNTTVSLGTVSLTAGVAGGVTDVFVGATDQTHKLLGYADCYQSASACEVGQTNSSLRTSKAASLRS